VQERADAPLAHLLGRLLAPVRLHELSHLLLQAHARHEILGAAVYAELAVLIRQ
jgi:hypothetical protein